MLLQKINQSLGHWDRKRISRLCRFCYQVWRTF